MTRSFPRALALGAAVCIAAPGADAGAQTPRATARQTPVASRPAPAAPSRPLDSLHLAALRWREIGPYRGGRSVAVAGSVQRPNEYYMGTTGGGVFKSNDGGHSWGPVTDRHFGGTVGAIEVAPSNPDIVYVGGGEYPIRGNVAHGDGVWKTSDGARTWTYLGLRETRHIADIVVHPRNPDIVWVGALGHVFGPNSDRGVFKSTDGGRTWRKTLFRSDSAGVVDLVMDPANPDVLYAAVWHAYRTPWKLVSGGTGSGIFKSTDGGETWAEITRAQGLPQSGLIGNVGLTVSGANGNRVYAIIEHDSGGVFRSDDAGRTWTRTNDDRSLRQRAWYYTKIHADPKNADVVYVNNVSFQRSTDGGKTFRAIRAPHGDSHDLWIAPDNPARMIEANDGGANVSTDTARTWTAQDYATAQFYNVVTTNHFPYRVCGAQQDNSTLCGPSRGSLQIWDWEDAGGGESGHIAPRHDDPDVVYAGSYGSFITRKDMRTGLERNVNPWPDNPMGHSAGDIRYRFQWTFPIVTSRHELDAVYVGSQHVHKSTNGGESWRVISPDLSYNDPGTLGPSGGPITRDQTSVEYYATVFAITESPRTRGELWVGTDDGRVHLTRNDGRTWTEITPPDMQKFTRVSTIDVSPHAPGTAYVAGNRYQLDDFRPWLWKTSDYGRTWTRIDAGIDSTEFTRVVRVDDVRPGLLFAGTERGLWVSLNDGASWQRLQNGLPPVPVHDLEVKEGDLVAGTHGRSFYVLDDLSVLRQMTDAVMQKPAHLFEPRDAYRVSFGGGRRGGGGGAGMPAGRTPPPGTAPTNPSGQNPPDGVIVQYWLAQAGQEVTLEFRDARGDIVRSFTSRQDSATAADSVRADQRRRSRLDSLRAAGLSEDSAQALIRRTPDAPAAGEEDDEGPRRSAPAPRAANRRGVNQFAWNMRYPDASAFRGMIMWAGGTAGPMAPPGTYSVRLLVDGRPVGTSSFRLLRDPRVKGVTNADLVAQFTMLRRIQSRLNEANDAVKIIRHTRTELADREAKLTGEPRSRFTTLVAPMRVQLADVEDSIYQTRNRSGQDPLNYPIRLNNRIAALMGVVGSGDGRPTQQATEVFALLSARLDAELARLKSAMQPLGAVNELLRGAGLAVIEPRPIDAPPPTMAGDGLQ
ncbi:MAG TPA: glycosyl hydrolase [Gemmatimonadaceae bacterium]|nr:glycosyl hydrolase [Gemmatimonadaceae bacterium]